VARIHRELILHRRQPREPARFVLIQEEQKERPKRHVAQVDGSFAPGAWAASIIDVVERVSPAVVTVSAQISREVAARNDQPGEESDQSTPFDDLLRRFQNRGTRSPADTGSTTWAVAPDSR